MSKLSEKTISHEEFVVEHLRSNPDMIGDYLRLSLEDGGNVRTLLIALRHVAKARGGIAKIAREAGIRREVVDRALSGKRSPKIDTIFAILEAMKIKLSYEVQPTE